VQFDKECACRSSIPAPFDEACDLENANGAIKPDRQNVADLYGVTGRGLADAIDADMASLHQSCSTAASFDHPRVPQPFIETLALQGSVPRRVLERFRAKWKPVRVKKTRQNKRSEPGFDSIKTEMALA
jgi:hypothetical protein